MRSRSSTLAALAALVSTIPTCLAAPATAAAAPDPCAKIAGKTFSRPADALACMKSFPFNETLRQNVLTVISRVFDFYTFEDYYLNSPPPFQDSTTNIRADIARINRTHYETDFDFNKDVYDFTTQLNDGHTRWFPDCYTQFQNLLPAPVVTLEENGVQNVFVAPDSVEFVSLLGTNFTGFFDSIEFDFRRLAGAKVLEIEGMDAYAYAQRIAETQSGNFIDLGVRINSAFSSYRISGTDFSQRFGDISGPQFPTQNTLTMKLIPVNSTKAETVSVPFLASYAGAPFANRDDFWAINCVANSGTNGVDNKVSAQVEKLSSKKTRKLAMANIVDVAPKNAVGLPSQFEPTLPPVNGSEGVIKSFILPDKKTGVMFVGSFEPDDFFQFQTDVLATVMQFKQEGVSQLLIDLTNNGGGFVCLGQFLHIFLTGSKSLGNFPNPGFQSTNRANPLAQKILASDIALGVTSAIAFYPADNWAFLSNDTEMSPSDNYMQPPSSRVINGQTFVESQRFLDVCPFNVDIPENPPFAPSKIAIVGNGNCASTCAMFSTLMNERHNTKIAVFGGKPGLPTQFKGMAGNQVLEWFDIDSEIKTANLKDDPLAPPDLLVSGDFRHNWRIAYSFLDETLPIEYKSELPHFRFPYTADTYNNPQNLWIFASASY
ncbi:hypothetical protein BN946_scf184880.g2 [Trametes cinnabarina]|uniref:Tail specific protease domain-containing protein n=1 Tax=Pycnoporus cinnabarinus TaxID=5643 RepID=A0A060SPR5_PYCCI|nr:hypothetical protein BN946_scf184880.g2 [Trametes cinnabarina]